MVEPLLIDLGDKFGDTMKANDMSTTTTDLTGAKLLSGLKIRTVVKDAQSLLTTYEHTDGIGIGVDKSNKSLIISQQPQTADAAADLRFSISLNDITATYDQERAINTDISLIDVSTLQIKALAPLKHEIVHTNQNKQQQYQERGLVELMCTLPMADLPTGTAIEISEVYKDIWGDNKLRKLAKDINHALNGGSMDQDLDAEDQAVDADDMAGTSSIPDAIWEGLENFDLNAQNPSIQKEIVLSEPEPWFKPEFVKPRRDPRPRRRNNTSRQTSTATVPEPATAPNYYDGSGSPPSHGLHRRYLSDISSVPQLPNRLVETFHSPGNQILNNSQSQSNKSSPSHQVSIGDLEGQMEEQVLKNLEAKSKAFWGTQGAKTTKPSYGERKRKFGPNPNKNKPSPGMDGACSESSGGRGLSREGWRPDEMSGWNFNAADNGGGNNGAGNSGAGARGHGAGGRGHRGARGGGRRRGARGSGDIDQGPPFPPNMQSGPQSSSYSTQGVFGGWNRYNTTRHAQKEGTYVGESSISFQRGVY